MRLILPWAFLGLLALGAGLGAALGQLDSPGETLVRWIDGVVLATQGAGSARLQFTTVTTSADPSLASKSAGVGVINFSEGDFRVTTLNRQHQFESINGGAPRLTGQIWGEETIAIGQTVYSRLQAGPAFSGWSKVRFPRRERQDFGLAATGAEDAVGGVVGPTPVAAVRPLGRGSVRGVPAARYRIATEPLYICGERGRTLYVHRFAPTTLWVDSDGRLLQARTSLHTPGSTSPGPPDPAGRSQPIVVAASTTVATLTFSDFGVPVHIAAPHLNRSRGSSESISLRVRGSTLPCHR